MKGAKEREWKEVPGLPGYFIDDQGLLIKEDSTHLKPTLTANKKDAFYTVCGKQVFVRETVRRLFGVELRIGAGWKKAVELRAQTPKLRRCHDCGKPTQNYRCSECWEKLRKKGFYLEPDEVFTDEAPMHLSKSLGFQLPL